MSRVHLRFVRCEFADSAIGYEIYSPDFTDEPSNEILLATVVIDKQNKKYKFAPSAIWQELSFISPLAIDSISQDELQNTEGVNYAARIHHRITGMMMADDYL